MTDNAFTELRTPRLILRRLQRDDLATLRAYRSLPEVARYQSWETFGPDDATQLIDSQSGLQPGVPGTWFQFAIVVAASGTLIGDCGLHCRLDDPRQMELGITLDPKHQRHGYAAEALACVIDFGFEKLGKHRISAMTDADNLPAAALLRRLGFRQEAHFIDHVWFKGAWGSEFVFATLRREWEHGRDRTRLRDDTASS